ncbi:unnamed protein product [Clavelina lepadiformis]|uniref:RING-type E3 ubiquitin transferase n=1 Tax=Clavelina lepadiformis TaxID=159417 RepID=A0ABP0FHV2_CLALP
MATKQSEENPDNNDEPWTKKILCRYFLHGICKYGSSCRYSHNRDTAPDLVCRYYQDGHCSYGERCRYDHVRVDKRNKSNSDTSQSRTSESSLIHSTSHDVDWVNAVEFVPGQQYSPRDFGSYSSVLKQGLDTSPDPGQVSASQKFDEICPFALNGECEYGDQCAFVHGLLCDMCNLYILHPDDLHQQAQHKEECMQYHVEDLKESFKIAESRDAVCGICMEVVWEKDEKDRKFGILENCNHMFCLDCIRKWRSAKAFNNTVVKACPQCRVSSSFVTPSSTWIEDKEEKENLIKGYKDHLSNKPCRYFDQGRGKCPFGSNCFYLHAYPDGSKQDRSKVDSKNVEGKNGRRTIDPNSLWDFIGERNEGGNHSSSLMELLQHDLELLDVVYLLGEDSFSSSEEDYDALETLEHRFLYGSDEFLDVDD